jgi:hypothetical protein
VSEVTVVDLTEVLAGFAMAGGPVPAGDIPVEHRPAVRALAARCWVEATRINGGPGFRLTETGKVAARKAVDRVRKELLRREIAADRRFAAALEEADRRGELVTHEPDDACTLGLWHTGGCER